MTERDLLKRLADASGPPGAEGEIRAIIREELAGCGEISYDGLGSIVVEKRGTSTGPRIYLDAHMDEVGFVVRHLREDGFLRFLPLGGWWDHVLLAQRVVVKTKRGDVPGIIGAKPVHFLSAEERKKLVAHKGMFIDIGARSDEEARSLGVEVGDPIVPLASFMPLGNPDYVSAKALDDRVGVALMIETLRGLSAHPNDVVGVGVVQEEVGIRGAKTASEVARPDVGVILEGTPADDIPGILPEERQAALGGGPQIRLLDPTAISSRRLVELVLEVAREIDVAVQLAVRSGGGTDAGPVHVFGRGVPTVVIGVPTRYIHTHANVIYMPDYDHARKLLQALVPRLDAKTVSSLTDFSGS